MKSILIADDDELMRWQLGRIVRGYGGEVVCSASSVEEVERNSSLDLKAVDAAIVDYEFEGYEKTGIDLIRYLKMNGVPKVALCTGYFEDEDIRSQAELAGADLIIPKPVDESCLCRIIRHEDV